MPARTATATGIYNLRNHQREDLLSINPRECLNDERKDHGASQHDEQFHQSTGICSEEEIDRYDDGGQNTEGPDRPGDKLYTRFAVIVIAWVLGYLSLVLRTEHVLGL
jgi:hypothetical protein